MSIENKNRSREYSNQSVEKDPKNALKTALALGVAGLGLATIHNMEASAETHQEKFEQQLVDIAESRGGGTFEIDGKKVTIGQVEGGVNVEPRYLRSNPDRSEVADNVLDGGDNPFDGKTIRFENPLVVSDAKNPANAPFFGVHDGEGNWYWTGAQELSDDANPYSETYTETHVHTADAKVTVE